MPPDLFGNIAASSAWMLFCIAPRQIEIVQRTNAPVVPSAPTEPPRDAIRNAGLQSATTKPSHHVIALRSCLSSTSACPIQAPSSLWKRLSYQLVQASQGLSTTAAGHRQYCWQSHATGPRPSRRRRAAVHGAAARPPGGAGDARGTGAPERRADGDRQRDRGRREAADRQLDPAAALPADARPGRT